MGFFKGNTYIAGDLYCEGKVLVEEQAGDDSTIVKFSKGSWTENRIPYCSDVTGLIGYSFFEVDTSSETNILKLINQNDFSFLLQDLEVFKIRKKQGSAYDVFALGNINPMVSISNVENKPPKIEVKGDLHIIDRNIVLNESTNLWEFI